MSAEVLVLIAFGAVIVIGLFSILESPRHARHALTWRRPIGLLIVATAAVLATPWVLYILGKTIGRETGALAIVAATVAVFLLLWLRGRRSPTVG